MAGGTPAFRVATYTPQITLNENSCPSCSNPLPVGTTTCPNCATAAQTGQRSEPGLPLISGYDLIGRIGEGGMGTIYLAEEKSLARRVAIKVVAGKLGSSPQARARFLREARSLATIEHANVVRIYAFGEVDGQPYLAMQYVEGETLADLIRRQGRLSVDESLRMMRQILVALEAAWEKGIVHRDVKPSNVLLDKRGQVHVADFGLAKVTQSADDPALSLTGHVLGTPYYVAPEQAQGKDTDFRADIYSCGILLYELLAGERPFEGTTPFAIVAKQIGEPLPSIQAKRPEVSTRIARMLERMTAKAPQSRPSSYAELIAEFDTLLGFTPSQPTRSVSFAPAQTKWATIAAICVIVLAASAAIAIRYRSRPVTALAPNGPDQRMLVAVAPFYGPDDDSAKEGRVMAALVERSITARLGAANVKVAGIDETKDPVRSHDAARALGERLGAAVVVWGEAFALRRETEIQPYFTLIRKQRPESRDASPAQTARDVDLKSADPVAELSEQSSRVVRLEAETPNQIELRKTSAEGVGEMVSFLAALHALYDENNPRKAIQFFEQAPRTAESLRHEAAAYLRLEDRPNAMKTLEAVLQLDPKQVQSRADLADLYLLANRFDDAVAAYRSVAASKQPFTTTQAIFSGDKLFRRELYVYKASSDEIIDDGTLLAIDPATGDIAARYQMPGLVKSFAQRPDGFSIAYESDRFKKTIDHLNYLGGRFDRPLIPGGLALRMKAMKAGWVLPANFMHEFTGIINDQPDHPRFRLTEKPDPALPSTLPDVERALRAAAQHDRTQPWHLFFLGHALAAQGKTAEAEQVWGELLRTEYPAALTYMNFMWISKYFERLGHPAWADRAYGRARTERLRLPQDIIGTSLIERLINVPIMRLHKSQLRDPERAHSWLVRARDTTGVTEADNYPATAWAGYYRRKGELARADEEQRFADFAAKHPLNYTSYATRFDYAVYAYLATLFGFLCSTVLLFGRAMRSNRHGSTVRPLTFWSAVHFLTGRTLPPLLRSALIAVEVSSLAFVIVAWFLDESWVRAVAVVTIAIVAVALTITVGRPIAAIRILTTRQRSAIVASVVLFFVAAGFFVTYYNKFARFTAIDVGFADALGHPTLIRSLEQRLAKHRTPERVYVTAVAHELAGNLERAGELYGELPNDARAIAARQNLVAGRKVSGPTARELFLAYTAAPWRPVMEGMGTEADDRSRRINAIHAGIAIFGIILIVAFVTLKPRPVIVGPVQTTSRLRRWIAKIIYLLLPGAYDLRHGAPERGVLTMILTGFAAWLWVGWLTSDLMGSPGPITANALPNVRASMASPLIDVPSDYMFAPIYARQFWAIAAVLVVTWLVLHVLRIPAILRLYRDENAGSLHH